MKQSNRLSANPNLTFLCCSQAKRDIEKAAAAARNGSGGVEEEEADNEPDLHVVREEKALDLQSMLGCPFQMALQALEVFSGDKNTAINWILDNTAKYSMYFEKFAESGGVKVETSGSTETDEAVVEDLGPAESLLGGDAVNPVEGSKGITNKPKDDKTHHRYNVNCVVLSFGFGNL